MLTLWNKILGALGAIGIIVLGSFALFFTGKKKGKEEEKAKQSEEVINEVIKTKEALDKRANDDIATRRERVCKHNRD